MICLLRSNCISPDFQNAPVLTTARIILLIILKTTLWIKCKHKYPTELSSYFSIQISDLNITLSAWDQISYLLTLYSFFCCKTRRKWAQPQKNLKYLFFNGKHKCMKLIKRKVYFSNATDFKSTLQWYLSG